VFLQKYLVPLRGGDNRRYYVVNFACFQPGVGGCGSLEGDERRVVSDCFWRHGKDISRKDY
jgi:hypothetical protein